jgi:hypothetical protein
MSDKFTIIIRSINRINQNDNTNDCYIKLSCPSSFSMLQCKVINFYVNELNGQTFSNQSYAQLTSDNLNITDKFDNLNAIAFADLVGSSAGKCPIVFKCPNFNTKEIHFRVLNSSGSLLLGTISGVPSNYDSDWTLVLECEGLNN